MTLREELASVDQYLDIETVRFGPTLVVDKENQPGQSRAGHPQHAAAAAGRELDQARPSPRRSAAGTSRSAAGAPKGLAIIEVVDDGTGMDETELGKGDGIGLRNVDERLRVIYGENHHLRIESTPGRGTCTRIEIPLLDLSQQASA